MDINTNQSLNREIATKPTQTQTTVTDTTDKQAQPKKPAEGEVIEGEIVDIKPDQVTIKKSDGELLTGQLKQPIEAKIGQQYSFTASFDKQAGLVLTMKAMPRTALQTSVLTDALAAFGFKPTSDNLEMALKLLNNKLPLNKETLQKFNQALKLLGSENTEKALFFIENEIPISSKNADTLNNLVSGNAKISQGLDNLMKSLNALPDGSLKQTLLKLLAMPESKTQQPTASAEAPVANQGNQATQVTQPEIKATLQDLPIETKNKLITDISKALKEGTLTEQKLTDLIKTATAQSTQAEASKTSAPIDMKKMLQDITELLKGDEKKALESIIKSMPDQIEATERNKRSSIKFNPQNTNLGDLEEYITNLKSNLTNLKAELTNTTQTPETAKLQTEINNLTNTLEFSDQIKNSLYLQIPIQINNQEANSEIFVFKDKNKTNKKSGSASALIALDTANLGRFEVYVQKEEKSIDCQFRLENPAITKLVKENIQALQNLLSEQNYSLKKYSFKEQSEPFTVIEKPEEKNDVGELKRMVVDIRT